MRLLAYAAAFLLAFLFGRESGRARTILAVILAVTTLEAAYGLLNHFAGWNTVLWEDEPKAYAGSVTGTFVNRNNFATYVNLGLLIGLAFLLESLLRAASGEELRRLVLALFERVLGRRVLLRDVRPDVVHFHNTFVRMSPAVYRTCREARMPVIQTLHNFRIVCPGSLLMRGGEPCEDCLRRALPWPGIRHGCWQGSPARSAAVAAMISVHRLVGSWDLVDVYIALTEFARAKFVEGGVPADRIVVKPNFVYPDPGQRDSGVGSFALFVGRLSPEKGIATLLEAWTRLAGVPLRIIGSGPLLNEVRRRSGSMSDVEVMGPLDRDGVVAAMKQARFLVFPSEWYKDSP
jgi:glycosyltransferase involved in cell wall biosynthesis